MKKVTFLGDKLNSKGIDPDTKKISPIKSIRTPKRLKEIFRYGYIFGKMGSKLIRKDSTTEGINMKGSTLDMESRG